MALWTIIGSYFQLENVLFSLFLIERKKMRSVKISKDFDMSWVQKVVFSRVENVILSTTNVLFYKKKQQLNRMLIILDKNSNWMKKEVL